VGEDARGERDRVDAGADGRVTGRQIHVRPEKVGTRFCLHFILFSSRDLVSHRLRFLVAEFTRSPSQANEHPIPYRAVLLAGCWWLICSERKVLLTGG
jgi:hypothetical protein